METWDKPFIVGIDLGTTNCAVGFVDLRNEDPTGNKIESFFIPQLTAEGEIRSLSTLPSFYYIPGPYDISEKSISLPWGTRSDNFAGVFARDQGMKVPSRLVSSAKSWLCNAGVDRKARILPWGDEAGFSKVSPVMASAAFLEHIRNAWNDFHQEEDLFLENQKVIITVPASFDETARDLTLEAAKLAGLKEVVLIEEPLAAFYNWLMAHEKDWTDHVKTGDLILVCDVGGGTTDFSLIALKSTNGSPGFERIAVGDHLILGGDNMDIALAQRMESYTSKAGSSLGFDRWKALCNHCRQAKEEILNNQVESRRITLMGSGSRLISGTLSVVLSGQDIKEVVLETFFPRPETHRLEKGILKELGLASNGSVDSGRKISQLGLPFEKNPAITDHLSLFLQRHVQDVKRTLGRDDFMPDWILFNGGSLKPRVIQERIIQGIQDYFKVEGKTLKTLENPDFDLAVARGAAYYGLVKTGHGVRVGSGSPRSYYLGVSENKGLSENHGNKQAMCVIERGIEEGLAIRVEEKRFDVLANQPVVFEMFSSSYRSGDKPGNIIRIDDTLTPMPPLCTVIQYGKKGEKTFLQVQLEALYSEIGTLEIRCKSLSTPHSWRLQFDLRSSDRAAGLQDETVIESSAVQQACDKITRSFSDESTKADLDTLARSLAEDIGEKKEDWPLRFLRTIADALLDRVQDRKISSDHEARWLNLMGFCLRPGFGDGFDSHRMKKLWKIYSEGPVKGNHSQVRCEWWVLWRRVAGGLNAAQQKQFAQDVGKLIFPKKALVTKLPAQEKLELWMAMANMERMEVDQKIRWGRKLLSDVKPGKIKSRELWVLSRLGARDMLYGSADRVIPTKEAMAWINVLLSGENKNPKALVSTVIQMARKTGDRLRDLEEENIQKIRQWILHLSGDYPDARLLEKVVPLEKEEKNAIFGESLPPGLMISDLA
ncbi:MAG: hsp70 family protein [Desulfobacteraceae bacterium]|nr:hsp70 family protein [Desulfobacteraceae bacterium]